MKEYMAYIDESGDPLFHGGASETFFVGAVIISKSDIEKFSELYLSIMKEHKL